MVPMLTCGLVRSNFAFVTAVLLKDFLVRSRRRGGATSCRLGSSGLGHRPGACSPVRWRHRRSLAGGLSDDLPGDVRGNLVVGVELHRVARPALGLRPQVADVAEHLRQRHQGADDAAAATLLHRLDDAPTGVEVADDVTHVVLGGDDLDGHHRFEQRGVGLAGRLLQHHRTGDLEGHLRRVDLVVLAVQKGQLQPHQRVPGQHAVLHGVLGAGVHRGDELLRDAPTGDRVDELVRGSVRGDRQRLQGHDDLGVLPRPTGLLLVRVVDLLHRAPDGLPVGDLRLADVRLDVELAAHPVHQDVQVQLAHAGDDRLTGLLVVADAEGRVLFGEALDRGTQLLLVGLALRLDRHRDDRLREGHRLQDHRMCRIAEGVAGGGLLETLYGDDVPGLRAGALLPLVGVHLVDLADPLLAVLGRVDHWRAAFERAGVHPDVGQLAEVLVRLDLEGQRGEGLARRRLAQHGRLAVGRRTLVRRQVDRRRQEVDHGVEHRLDALVLERRAAQYRVGLADDRGAADAGLDVLGRELLALEVALHDGVIDVRERLDELLAVLGGLLGEVGRDLLDRIILAFLGLAAPGQRAHPDQVDDADEVVLVADRQLEYQRRGVEPVDHHLDAAEKVGAGAVQLVDEAHPRDVVLVGLPPDVLGLRLHAGHAVVDRDGTVQYPQRPLDLDGEVDVAGRVDDLDRVALPLALGRGGGDGDAPLLLLLHPVHDGSALVDLTDLVRDAGVEQDPLGRGRLTSVDMRHDADVAYLGERVVGGSHFRSLLLRQLSAFALIIRSTTDRKSVV